MKAQLTINKRRKNKTNLVTLIRKETNILKKISLINKKNRLLKRSIDIINLISLMVMILIGIPVQLHIMDKISDIEYDHRYILALLLWMLAYYFIMLIVYLVTVAPVIIDMKDEIADNHYKIRKIRSGEDEI